MSGPFGKQIILSLLALCVLGCGSRLKNGEGGKGDTGVNVDTKGKAKQKVLLEIHRMAGLPNLQDQMQLRAQAVSLSGIYAAADLALEVKHDQGDLPFQESLRLADLHGLMTAFQSVPAATDTWKIHVLVVTQDEDRPDTLGIMFDFDLNDVNDAPREGCAVFVKAHENLPGGVNAEMLLTTAHELAHCFNLHHSDWEGSDFYRDATIESYSFTDTVRWELSPLSKKHLKSEHRRLVKPGKGNLPFGVATAAHLQEHKSFPLNSYDVVEVGNLDTISRVNLVERSAAVRAVVARERTGIGERQASPLKLTLQSPKTTFALGEPVIITVKLSNEGSTAAQVISLLSPEYGFLNMEIQYPGHQEFVPFRPVVMADARGQKLRSLRPGDSIYAELKPFFGAQGWTFKQPGSYSVRVDFPAAANQDGQLADQGRVMSESLRLTIAPAQGEGEAEASRLLLDQQTGLYLYLEGGDHLTRGAANLRQVATKLPSAAQAPAVRLALGVAALQPTIDPTRRLRPAANVAEAGKYLEGLLDSRQSPIGLVRAYERLAQEHERGGNAADATRLRSEMVTKLGKAEAVQQALQGVRSKIPPGE